MFIDNFNKEIAILFHTEYMNDYIKTVYLKMFSHIFNKKDNLGHFKEESVIKNEKNNCGSTSGVSACCETRNDVYSKRKVAVAKDGNVKFKSENSGTLQAEKRTEKANVMSPQIMKPAFTAVTRKNTDNSKTNSLSSCNIKSHTPVFKSKLSRSKRSKKIGEKDIKRRSLAPDMRRECVCLPSPRTESMLLTPCKTLKFNNINLVPNERNVDYFEEYDDVLRNTLLYQVGKFYTSPEAKDVFSLAPKLSPASEPIILKKKTYNCRILSLNGSAGLSSDTQNNSNEDRREPGNDDDSYSSVKESEAKEESVLPQDDSSPPLKCEKEMASNSKVLFINEPMRIKYIDEEANQRKELLIYSDEFLDKTIKEKCKMSKKDIFECLLQQSVYYSGKTLRIIPDVKKFLCKLQNKGKSQLDVKGNSTIKLTETSPKASSNTNQTKKSASSTPRSDKSHGNRRREESLKAKKSFMVKLPKEKDWADQTYVVKSFRDKEYPSRAHSVRNGIPEGVNFRKEAENSIENGRRSRTALKRINIEEIMSSSFKNYFHFYAKFGSRLKTGVSISKYNSNFWLKMCGIIFDDDSEKIADACFDAIARTKCVLNIIDYLQYLIMFARKRRMFTIEIIQQLMSINTRSLTTLHHDLEKTIQVANQKSIKEQAIGQTD